MIPKRFRHFVEHIVGVIYQCLCPSGILCRVVTSGRIKVIHHKTPGFDDFSFAKKFGFDPIERLNPSRREPAGPIGHKRVKNPDPSILFGATFVKTSLDEKSSNRADTNSGDCEPAFEGNPPKRMSWRHTLLTS